LLPQVVITPILYISRHLLNSHKKIGLGYLISALQPLGFFLALTVLLIGLIDKKIIYLAYIGCSIAFIQAIFSILLVHTYCKNIRWKLATFSVSLDFIKNSISMRSAHSLNNFFAAMFLSNVTSHFPEGSIAIFQYAKRFVDGITSITTSQNATLFHTSVAKLWATQNIKINFKKTCKTYLNNVIPLYFGMTTIIWIGIPYLFNLIEHKAGQFNNIEFIQSTFLGIALWQLVITIEVIYIAVPLAANQSSLFWKVNSLFLINLWLISHLLPSDMSVTKLPYWIFSIQIVSTLLYKYYSSRILNQDEHATKN
jgi:hypothetical protein